MSELTSEDTAEILRQFPPVDFAFAYGSGAVSQGGYDYNRPSAELPMLDMVFAVADPYAWHRENMQLHPDHYTPLIPLSSSMVAFAQDRFGAGMWYNVGINMNISKFPDRKMKYGVISTAKLTQDLTEWSCLYAAGRLHKPVKILQGNSWVEHCMELNRIHAMRTSLLLMPAKFSEVELYMGIASLSYIGDPRMIVGENPKKIVNLVTPIVSAYRNLYKSEFSDLSKVVRLSEISSSRKVFVQDCSPSTRWDLCLNLPKSMKQLLMLPTRARFRKLRPPNRPAIRTALASIVARAASSQSIKGLLTAGLFNSSSYVLAKLAKSFTPAVGK